MGLSSLSQLIEKKEKKKGKMGLYVSVAIKNNNNIKPSYRLTALKNFQHQNIEKSKLTHLEVRELRISTESSEC